MKKRAMLLLGPTGVGKTPFGQLLERDGVAQKRVAHFDFGDRLRAVTTGKERYGLSDEDVVFIGSVLKSGALLENKTFYLAEKIITHFLDNEAAQSDLVLLNGLPRHVGQAADVAPFLDVFAVLHLRCDAATVRDRIRLDTGGDRAERDDDGLALVEKKLQTFAARTVPLIEHYKVTGAHIIEFDVNVDTTAAHLRSSLANRIDVFR